MKNDKKPQKLKLKALLDSGANATIAVQTAPKGLDPQSQTETVWTSTAGKFETSKNAKISPLFLSFLKPGL